MIYFFPFRYVDRSRFYAISEIDSASAYIQLRGVIRDVRTVGAQRGKRLVATLSDDTGAIDLVFFQGVKWMSDKIKAGKEYIVFGKPSSFNGELNMVHPEIDEVSSVRPGTGAMTGVYPSTEHLKNSLITNKVIGKLQALAWEKCADSIVETLPQWLIADKGLCSLKEALHNIHFPKDVQSLARAQHRLKFEELFYLQLSLLKQKNVRMRGSNGSVMHSTTLTII